MDKLEAVASFLGQRYSNTGHGTVDNWIVGNEINARQEWNYMNSGPGIDYYAAEYAKAVRIFCNGIRSENGNARVYAAYDHAWASSDNAALHYSGQQVLARMAADITAEGNIDWGLSFHPYNALLTDPTIWNGYLTPHKMDHAAEIAQGMLFGLKNPDRSNKLAYNWYQNVNSPDVQAQAAQVMGIQNLSQLITAR